MGYDLHITRREFWSDEEGLSITLEEWQTYAAGDAEIEADPENPGPENWQLSQHTMASGFCQDGFSLFAKFPRCRQVHLAMILTGVFGALCVYLSWQAARSGRGTAA